MKMVGLSLDAQESCSINVVNSLKVTATSYVLLNLVSNSKFKWYRNYNGWLLCQLKLNLRCAKDTYIIWLYLWQMKALFPSGEASSPPCECDQRLQNQLHNYSDYKLTIHSYILVWLWIKPAEIANKRIRILKDSEVFSGSHQYAFLVGTDCCRRAEPPHFCQEHKSLFQAMIQRNHLALPILSSPCYPHHSTK